MLSYGPRLLVAPPWAGVAGDVCPQPPTVGGGGNAAGVNGTLMGQTTVFGAIKQDHQAFAAVHHREAPG